MDIKINIGYRLWWLFLGLLLSFSICCGNKVEPRILHYHFGYAKVCGGIDHYIITLCDLLQEKGYFACIATNTDTVFETQITKKGKIPYFKVPAYNAKSKDVLRKIEQKLINICKKQKINIINCHRECLCGITKSVAKKLGIKSVYFDHHYRYIGDVESAEKYGKNFGQLSAFFGNCQNNVDFLKKENEISGLGIEKISKFTPFSNLKRIRAFLPPPDSKHLFFLKNFSIDIDDHVPTISMIANLGRNKNHLLLFDAIYKLVYRDKMPVQVVLAGDGNAYRGYLEECVEKMNLGKFVYFLGYTDFIPEILHYSDMLTLVSFKESCGLVLFEAALSKLPIILSKTVEVAGSLICHEQTGLLVDPLDSEDLVVKIKKILFDRELREKIINNAYNLILTEGASDKMIEPVEECYLELAATVKKGRRVKK